MPVFLVMCTKKAGVEKLLDCKIIESLTECKFIDCRPELEPTFEGERVHVNSKLIYY